MYGNDTHFNYGGNDTDNIKLHLNEDLSPKVQPYVLVAGGEKGSYPVKRFWQNVRGPSQQVSATYGNWWSAKYTTTRRGRWFSAGRMTAPRTIKPLLNPKSKCRIGTWQQGGHRIVEEERGRPRDTWGSTIEALGNENNREDMERTWHDSYG